MTREVDSIEQSLENIRAIADEFRMETSGDKKWIATTHTQAKYFPPEVLMEFRQRYPAIAIHLLQGTAGTAGGYAA
ncbi:MAG: hypothetical protein R3E89_10955 [Thiolinea sp.]